MSHFQVKLLAKSSSQILFSSKTGHICIEKYRFLVFINCDKTNIRNENWIEKLLMSEVTVNNKLKLGICFEMAAQLYFFPKLA
jgi:hypothetical protein